MMMEDLSSPPRRLRPSLESDFSEEERSSFLPKTLTATRKRPAFVEDPWESVQQEASPRKQTRKYWELCYGKESKISVPTLPVPVKGCLKQPARKSVFRTPEHSPVTLASHDKSIRFALSMAREYDSDKPSHEFQPMTPERAAQRFPIEESPQDQNTQDTKDNYNILAAWDDSFEVFEDTEELLIPPRRRHSTLFSPEPRNLLIESVMQQDTFDTPSPTDVTTAFFDEEMTDMKKDSSDEMVDSAPLTEAQILHLLAGHQWLSEQPNDTLALAALTDKLKQASSETSIVPFPNEYDLSLNHLAFQSLLELEVEVLQELHDRFVANLENAKEIASTLDYLTSTCLDSRGKFKLLGGLIKNEGHAITSLEALIHSDASPAKLMFDFSSSLRSFEIREDASAITLTSGLFEIVVRIDELGNVTEIRLNKGSAVDESNPVHSFHHAQLVFKMTRDAAALKKLGGSECVQELLLFLEHLDRAIADLAKICETKDAKIRNKSNRSVIQIPLQNETLEVTYDGNTLCRPTRIKFVGSPSTRIALPQSSTPLQMLVQSHEKIVFV